MCFGFVTPTLVTLLLTINGWNLVFHVTALFSFTGGIVFVVFGSAKRQNWFNNVHRRDKNAHEMEVKSEKSLMSQFNRQRSSIFGEGI